MFFNEQISNSQLSPQQIFIIIPSNIHVMCKYVCKSQVRPREKERISQKQVNLDHAKLETTAAVNKFSN